MEKIHNMSEDQQAQCEVQLSLYACANCKRQHKRCDKRLPKCTLCTQRRKECVYEPTTKRGPKGRAEYCRPYPEIVHQNGIPQMQKELSISPPNTSQWGEQDLYNLFRSTVVDNIIFDMP